MDHRGALVAVDLPSPRIARLRDNMNSLNAPSLQRTVVEADLLKLTSSQLSDLGLDECYDAVMLDAPCSNTGVIQRRTDVKWRLRANDIGACTALQFELLTAASRFVRPGGRLVYSTCSIEPEENRKLIDHFLASQGGQRFKLEGFELSFPWESGHDGAGAFLLRG